jgi:hypothetical protein
MHGAAIHIDRWAVFYLLVFMRLFRGSWLRSGATQNMHHLFYCFAINGTATHCRIVVMPYYKTERAGA